MIDTKQTLDILFLNQDFAKDCKCESQTHEDEHTVCSVKVTHRVVTVCGKGDKLLCQVATETLQRHIDSEVILCAYCNHPAELCWSIRPV